MTTKATHTPGPWRYGGAKDRSSGNRLIMGGKEDVVVAQAEDRNCFDLDSEVDANARLIAAAPELLAALRAVMECDDSDNKEALAAYEMARAAIAKAEGRGEGRGA